MFQKRTKIGNFSFEKSCLRISKLNLSDPTYTQFEFVLTKYLIESQIKFISFKLRHYKCLWPKKSGRRILKWIMIS